MSSENQRVSDSTERELAALAEGSLSPRRAQRLSSRVQQEPELAAKLAMQRRALELEARAHRELAPAELQREVALMHQSRKAERPRRNRPVLFGGVLAAGGACAAVLIIALGASSEGSPTVSQTLALARGAARLPAPAEQAGDARMLRASVGGVAFPYWGKRSAWQPSGAREDRLSGRVVKTVFYSSRTGQRIGYAIVAGAPLPVSGGVSVSRDGVRYRSLTTPGGDVVTWVEGGHTCVLAGNAGSATLLHLAALS